MEIEQFFLKDDGTFPNSDLPVLIYRGALNLAVLFKGASTRRLFRRHGWTNNWKSGIYTYHHYHSTTHEAIGVYKGSTKLQLGGEAGEVVTIKAGDIVIIPAGVAHKNLGKEKDVSCVGGYPDGKTFDMNYGKQGERPAADRNISKLTVPATDPLMGRRGGLKTIWENHAFLKVKNVKAKRHYSA